MQGFRGRFPGFMNWLADRLARSRSLHDQPVDTAVLRHEFFNPLNGLLGMIQLLRQSGLSGEQTRLLVAAEQSARQMAVLVERLSDDDRAAYSNPRPDVKHIDGVGVLEQTIWNHTPAAAARGLQLLLLVDEQVPRWWRTDASLLRQVLDNLLGNAIKFTEAGHVRLEARFNAGKLELLVRDTGIGIHPDSGTDIFELGHRGLRESRGHYKGSGLGLWVCREIVHVLHGDIDYSSRPGAGSCFRFRLPGRVAGAGRGPDGFRSGLLDSLDCRVLAAEPLATAVHGVLARLGVRSSDIPEPEQPAMMVEITGPDRQLSDLCLTAYAGRADAALTRRLAAPVLECTLGPLLIEIALELTGRA